MTFGRMIAAAALAVALPSAAMAQSAYNWTGAYIGANIGAASLNSAVDGVSLYNDVDGTSLATTLPGFSYSGSGIIGGGEIGYNWQASGFVFGVEGDISASNTIASYTDFDNNFTVDTKLNWLSTARVKLGLPFSNFLLYGTGGVAVGQIQGNLQDRYPDDSTIYNLSSTQTAVGWTAGGGIAAAIDEHVVVKAEYLYTDLGSHTFSYSEDPTGAIGWPLTSSSAKVTSSLIRVGIDYKF
jgi:outer membrane immunogenic protein